MAEAAGVSSLSTAGARRSARIRGAVGKDSGFEPTFKARDEECGACLLEIDAPGEDGEFVAILDCCRPRHCFHVACILTWAEQENSCPQCKKRFAKIAVYGEDGRLLRATRVNEKDQDFGDSDAEGGADEDDICQVCQKTSDEAAMLLCDGQHGRCNTACHYYCVGLDAVPEGDWFCPACSEGTACADPDSAESGVVSPAVRVKIERTESPVRDTVRPGQITMDWSPSRVKRELGSEVHSPPHLVPKPAMPPASQATQCTEAESAEAEAEAAAAVAAMAVSASSAFPLARVKHELFHNEGVPCPAKEGVAASASAFGNLRVKRERREPLDIAEPSVGTITSRPSDASLSHREAAELAAKEFEEASQQMGHVKVKTEKVKAEVDGEDGFGGLCKAMPKWISRQGGIVKVDLGGRGMRDAAAIILAEVIGKALNKLVLGVRKDEEFNIALQLAGNLLHKAGLMAILEAVEKVTAVRVLRLHAERNRLDGFATAALAEWCCRQARGPPDELYLSSNKICDAGMLKLLRLIGRDRRRRIAAGKPCRKQPIWLELHGNRVCRPHDLLDALCADVPVCLAIDRTSCSSSKCTSHDGSDEGHGLGLPSIHLPDFEDQEPAEDREKGSKGSKCPRREQTVSSATAKCLKTAVERPVPQGAAKVLSPTSAAYARAEVALKSKLAVDEAVEESQFQRAQSTQPRRYVDANGCLHVTHPGPEQSHLQPSAEVAARQRGQTEGNNWAQHLGKRARGEQPAFEFMHKDDAPPSFGLWDVADRDPAKRVRRGRNIGRELLKDLGVVESATSSCTKTGGTHSPVGARKAHVSPVVVPTRHFGGPVPETPNLTCRAMHEPLASFYVDNSELSAQTPGLDYRYSKDFDDRCPPGNWACWGSTVRGSAQGDWLRTGDHRYLPVALNGKTVLRRLLAAPVAKPPDIARTSPAPGRPVASAAQPPGPPSRFAPRKPVASAEDGHAEPPDAGTDSAAALGGNTDEPEVDATPQVGRPPEDVEVLKQFVNERLRREKHFTRTLFGGLDEDRLRMRWRCLRDQLANLAHGKYLQVVACAAGSWASYLETSQGRDRVGSWVQKKLEEATSKREIAQKSAASQRSSFNVVS